LKPIFEPERQFFYRKTNILLPKDCWRDGTKIYLDCTCKKPLYKFKVENKKIKITKNNTELFENYKQKTIETLISVYSPRIDAMITKSIYKTKDFIVSKPNELFMVSHSGGKDSTVVYNIWQKTLEEIKVENEELFNNLEWEINFSNTSNETADTYKYIKKHLPKNKLKILNPKIGFYQWIINIKNYFTPSVMVRNCCSTYKEGQLTANYDKKQNINWIIGVRSSESAKRSKYTYEMSADFYINILGKNNLPSAWVNFAPIVEWTDEEVWLYILRENLPYNNQYNVGFNRCGCLICPYQSDYIDLLIEEYYPNQWKRWLNILEKGFEIYHIASNFKWTLNEWLQGKWKAGHSKEFEIIYKKPTKENIKILTEIKGISELMAIKYFNKKCKCGKKMNPTELAMFYKTFGRYENIENDNRDLLCKKCFCKEQNITTKEYRKLVLKYTDEGCNLF
jgi:3'-phosphoadenosine 5'-phosphosulfate sulfotransferase (PAPS reductase)/FAD synthetase